MTGTVESRVEAIAERVGRGAGLEIVEVEMKGSGPNRVLRIYIDKPGGVTHGDCERVSVELGTILDVEDVVPGGSYRLEVSSPGLERKLRKPADYERFQWQKARVVLREPVDNSRHWEGRLAGLDQGLVALEVAPGRTLRFAFEQIEKAKLKFEWGARA